MKDYRYMKNLEKIKQKFVFEGYKLIDKKSIHAVDTNLRISIELAKKVS